MSTHADIDWLRGFEVEEMLCSQIFRKKINEKEQE